MLDVVVFDVAAPVLIVVLMQIVKVLFPSLTDDSDPQTGQPSEKRKKRNAAIQLGIVLAFGLIFSFGNWIIEGMDVRFVAFWQAFWAGILSAAASVGIYSGQKSLRGVEETGFRRVPD